MVIRGERLHSLETFDPTEAASTLESLDLMQTYLQKSPYLPYNDHSV